jgi:hypothetical protein
VCSSLVQKLASDVNVPVIVTSGDSARAEQAGLLCFQKPFRQSELEAAISSFGAKGLCGGI